MGPYNTLAKAKVTLALAKVLCKAKRGLKWAAECLPDLMQTVEIELDLDLLTL